MDNSTSEYCRFLESKIVDHLVGDEKEEFHSMNAESHSYDSQIDGMSTQQFIKSFECY